MFLNILWGLFLVLFVIFMIYLDNWKKNKRKGRPPQLERRNRKRKSNGQWLGKKVGGLGHRWEEMADTKKRAPL